MQLPTGSVLKKEGLRIVGSVDIVSPYDMGVLLNNHSIVFRVIDSDNEYNLTPFYLFSHQLTQKQIFNKIMIDTTLPNIGNRGMELRLPISNSEDERCKEFCTGFQERVLLKQADFGAY